MLFKLGKQAMRPNRDHRDSRPILQPNHRKFSHTVSQDSQNWRRKLRRNVAESVFWKSLWLKRRSVFHFRRRRHHVVDRMSLYWHSAYKIREERGGSELEKSVCRRRVDLLMLRFFEVFHRRETSEGVGYVLGGIVVREGLNLAWGMSLCWNFACIIREK